MMKALTDKQELAEFKELDELKEELGLNAIKMLIIRNAVYLKHWSLKTGNDIRKMSPRELAEVVK